MNIKQLERTVMRRGSLRLAYKVPTRVGQVVLVLVEAITGNGLTVAPRTALHVTTYDVKLSLNHSAVGTRSLVSTPVVGFATVPNALKILPTNLVVSDGLRLLYFLRPTVDHPNTSVDHERLSVLVVTTQRLLLAIHYGA